MVAASGLAAAAATAASWLQVRLLDRYMTAKPTAPPFSTSSPRPWASPAAPPICFVPYLVGFQAFMQPFVCDSGSYQVGWVKEGAVI